MEDIYVTNVIDYSKHVASMISFEEELKKFENPKDIFIVVNCYDKSADNRTKLTAVLFVMKRILEFNKGSGIKYFPVITTLEHEDTLEEDYIVCGYYYAEDFDNDEYLKFISTLYNEFCKNVEKKGGYIYELATLLTERNFAVNDNDQWSSLCVTFFYNNGNIENKTFYGKYMGDWFNSELKELIKNSLKTEVGKFDYSKEGI